MLNREKIFLDKNLSSKDEVLSFISEQALKLNLTDDKEGLLADLWKRENEYSTGIQCGFAIPHTKSKHVKEPSILFIKTNEEIEWETLDDSKVRYVFNLLAPEESQGNIHLQMLSKLATCLMEDDFIEEVKNASDENYLVKYILNKMEEE